VLVFIAPLMALFCHVSVVMMTPLWVYRSLVVSLICAGHSLALDPMMLEPPPYALPYPCAPPARNTGHPDNIMKEIPTVVVDPMPESFYPHMDYVVLNRPYAVSQTGGPTPPLRVLWFYMHMLKSTARAVVLHAHAEINWLGLWLL